MNREEAQHILAREMEVFRSKSHSELVGLVGSPTVFSRIGPDGTEYQIEVEVLPDSPRHPQGDMRVIGSIDDGRLLSSIKPLTQDFIKTPAERLLGE